MTGACGNDPSHQSQTNFEFNGRPMDAQAVVRMPGMTQTDRAALRRDQRSVCIFAGKIVCLAALGHTDSSAASPVSTSLASSATGSCALRPSPPPADLVQDMGDLRALRRAVVLSDARRATRMVQGARSECSVSR